MQLSAQNAAGRRGGGGWRRGKRREREGGVGRQKDSGKKVGQRQKSEREKTDAKRTGKGERRKGATRGERCRESRDRVGGTETETEAKWRGRGRGERRKGATREVRGERLQGVEGVAVKALVLLRWAGARPRETSLEPRGWSSVKGSLRACQPQRQTRVQCAGALDERASAVERRHGPQVDGCSGGAFER